MDKPLAGRRFLVVEDETMILMMIEGMLEDLGCTSITAAGTCDQAIFQIKDKHFDAAMLDMNLDGHDSQVVADALAARGIPFLYSTGYITGHDMRDGFHGRAVLRKPFSFEELNAALARLIGG